MRSLLSRFSFSVLLLALYSVSTVTSNTAPEQIPLSSADVPSQLELASLSSEAFTTFTHPFFPGRSARIKKSNFCDGTVPTYSGYIDIGTRHLFFYFFESRNDSKSDDVIFWTNGGPGGSSAFGLLMELGPCNIVSANKTEFNPYSWNSNANIFFIDQPVGVGFSYADYGETVSTTEEAAKDIAAFAALFFETFSAFKGRPFHMAGESYGGRYIPVFASAVYDQNARLIAQGLTPVNLKSIMIGNGVTNDYIQILSYYDMTCTNASIEPLQSISTCIRMKQAVPRCERMLKAACIDHFDFIDCSAAYSFCMEELMLPFYSIGRNQFDMSMECDNTDLCYTQPALIEKFLNQPRIRDELGVASAAAANYSIINFELNKRFEKAGDHLALTDLYVAELLERGVKILIFVGELDWSCNWVGNERWVRRMEWSGKEGLAREEMKEWVTGAGETVSTAGKILSFGGLTFATVRGAGHMVPLDKPAVALEMLQRWLADGRL